MSEGQFLGMMSLFITSRIHMHKSHWKQMLTEINRSICRADNLKLGFHIWTQLLVLLVRFFFSHLKCHCNHGVENIQTLTNRLNVIHEQNLSRRNSFTKNFFFIHLCDIFQKLKDKIKDEINKSFIISMTE